MRYWFEFDLTGHAPAVEPGTLHLDGGSAAWRLLGRGAGVTGYDQADCLRLLEDQLGSPLPELARVLRRPVIGPELARQVGNPAWRGIWFPYLNRAGPVIG